jgi:SAM-dependent methyltransferase
MDTDGLLRDALVMAEATEQEQRERPKLLINLGSGPKGAAPMPALFADWQELRVDADIKTAPDLLADITDLSAIETGSADAVYMAHCLEHLYLHQAGAAIREIYRILADHGFLCLIVPDLQSLAEFFAKDRLHEVVYTSPAGPITAHDIIFGFTPLLARGNFGMAHRCGFTPTLLVRTLREAPFAEVVLRRRANTYELLALATKRKAASDAEREALLQALEP